MGNRKRNHKWLVANLCLAALIMPLITACESPNYVYRDGVKYYDANGTSTDAIPSGPYTKNGQYYVNPDVSTNTRDNRGSRTDGYDHDVSDDAQTPPVRTVVRPSGTVVYDNGTVVSPGGGIGGGQ